MHKILLVEDEVMLRDVFTLLLKANGYDVDAASNGQEALDKCREQNYDLILLDLMMPVLDGVGFLRAVSQWSTPLSSRIILLSNLSSGDSVQEALTLGVHRQEVKSNLSPKELIAVIESELAVTN